MPATIPRQEKGLNESRWYTFDFSKYPEVRDMKESIITVTLVSIDGTDSALTSTNVAPLDKDGDGINERAAVRLTGGTVGVVYTLTVTATTNAGNVLEGRGLLEVIA